MTTGLQVRWANRPPDDLQEIMADLIAELVVQKVCAEEREEQ